jgi:hypothetical protein
MLTISRRIHRALGKHFLAMLRIVAVGIKISYEQFVKIISRRSLFGEFLDLPEQRRWESLGRSFSTISVLTI